VRVVANGFSADALTAVLLRAYDDGPKRAAVAQRGERGARGEEVAGQVGVDDGPERVRVDVPERLRLLQEPRVDGAHPQAGVEHEDVQPAEQLDRAVGARRHRGLVAGVDAEAVRPARAAEPGGHVGRSVGVPAGEHDVGPVLDQGPDHGEAETAGAAGDEYAPAGDAR